MSRIVIGASSWRKPLDFDEDVEKLLNRLGVRPSEELKAFPDAASWRRHGYDNDGPGTVASVLEAIERERRAYRAVEDEARVLVTDHVSKWRQQHPGETFEPRSIEH